MKRYGVGVVRERLAEALDYADQGVPVVIERRGVRYRLTVDRVKKPVRMSQTPYIEILDPAVERGDWTWDWAPGRLTYKRRPRRK
ncbi:MAG: hypothetical protein ACRD1V_03525 [Vicinamibacterales bacterium]